MQYPHSHAELQSAIDVADTNAPINERAGNHAQAKFERERAAEYREALKKLQS